MAEHIGIHQINDQIFQGFCVVALARQSFFDLVFGYPHHALYNSILF